MHQNTYNAIRFRHVHFWNDTEHYRTDQRWKPRHNRIMWRITPESTITTDKKIHPEIVRNLKGRVLDTDYCIKHYGHIDKRKSAERAIFYRSIDNASLPDWSGNNYTHMTDESELKLAKWDENTPIDARDFGNPSVMLVLMHGGGDMLMATPTIRALASQNPNLEISVMGLGKTQERISRRVNSLKTTLACIGITIQVLTPTPSIGMRKPFTTEIYRDSTKTLSGYSS